MKPETRSLTPAPSITGRKVSGYAALFNSRSENLGTAAAPWFEVVMPGAFPDLTKQDCRALFNHDPNLILARSKQGQGTLKLSIDSKGLRYEFTAPNTSVGNDLVESLKRGDIDGASFSFTVKRDRWIDEKGVRVRQIIEIGSLLDISPTAYPAYKESSASVRNNSTAQPHYTVTNAAARFKLYETEAQRLAWSRFFGLKK